MSRAFVKEEGDAPPPPPLARRISAAPNRVTPRGLRLIGEQVARIEAALAAGPDAEAEALLRRDHRYWSARRAAAQPVAADPAPRTAGFGVLVTLRRGNSVQVVEIVGEDEADPAEGRVAWTAPLARALDGAGPGEKVELEAGGRNELVEILSVAPGAGA